MAEYVRVSDKETRHHYSVPREQYDATPELWDELKQPAADAAGDPLPPKYHTSVAKSAPEKQAAKPATSEKENS